MYSIDRTSPVPSDTHSIMSNETETEIESSTPELNLLLDKLTEILRFRSGCRRHFNQQQQQQQQSNSSSTTNLKRLQSGSIEPLHNNNTDVASTGVWKSSNNHHKPSISNRSSHHHHHHINLPINDKKRRLPSLLQRLIDEGNLIKEAVRRLKSQRFSHSFKQQQPTNIANTPSTPTTKSSLPNVPLSSASINIPQQLSDPPTQTTSSPRRGKSWFLSSSVFGTTNHNSGSGSPLRTYSSSSTHDRTLMEIGIHDG
jgi:hypothetical protein